MPTRESPAPNPGPAAAARQGNAGAAGAAGRLTLGLYNGYDPGRWHDIMRVSLCRAAPIAMAFDCDLATFGFPYDEGRRREAKRPSVLDLRNPVETATWVQEGTSIGDGAEHLVALARAKRFTTHAFPGHDAKWPRSLGTAVVTSPAPQSAPDAQAEASPAAPAPSRQVTPLQAAMRLERGEDLLVVIGLGPRGLPSALLAAAPHCLELTGRNISLETATALAAIPAVVMTHLAHLREA